MKITGFFMRGIIGVILISFGAWGDEITIGTGTSTWTYPLSTYYHDARTQIIYLASETGEAKTLTSLALYVSTLPGQTLKNFTIRLKHTDLSAYEANPVWESLAWTTVYQANQTVSTTGWATFPFSTLFVYNGVQNLMVDISFNNTSSSSYGYCYYTTSGVHRSINYATNSSYGDPLTWSSRSPAPSRSLYFPNIRLNYAPPTYVVVPNAAGMTRAEAQTAIIAAGLNVDCTYAFHESVPKGNVINQSPVAEQTVCTGAYINIVLSLGQSFSGGSGTANDPYQITSPADLQILKSTPFVWNSHFILTADIDLSGQTFTGAIVSPDTDSTAPGFQGTAFTGTFDGNGHTIKNISINGTDYLGLFGYVGTHALIKHLGVENINVTGHHYIGGVAGYQYLSTLAGCYASGVVSGDSYVGGLAGYNWANIENCYSAADVSGSSGSQYIGGLVGYNSYFIKNSYSIGLVAGTNSVGGFAGYDASINAISACFWDTQTSGRPVGLGYGSSTEVIGKTTDQMKAISTFATAEWSISNLDGFDADWIIMTEGLDYPKIICFIYDDPSQTVPLSGSGSQQYPYQIGSPEDIVSLSQYYSIWDKYFILTANLDMSGFAFRPIGNSVIRFTGNFNGQDFVIRNVSMNLPNKDYTGLFGFVGSGGAITHLGVEDETVIGKKYVGGLVGYHYKGVISSCHSTGIVTGQSTSCIGGLVGTNMGGTVSDSHSSVNLSGAGANIGGLVGCSCVDSVITNCSAGGAVTDNDPNNFGSYAGGLVGNNNGGTIVNCSATGHVSSASNSFNAQINIGGLVGACSSGSVSGCYARGSVHAVSSASSSLISAGGLMGLNSFNQVDDCYAAGSVTFNCGDDSGNFIGGMLGLNYEGLVSRCYAAGMVGSSGNSKGDFCVGGFCGFNTLGRILGCFWDIVSSGKTTSGGGRGLATEQMKSVQTYQNAGWANNGWIIQDEQDYPHLAWEGTEGISVPEPNTVELIGTGTAQNPYQIWTVEDFAVWGQYASVLEKHTVLMANLDFEGIDFIPIGQYGPFTGTFDGNDHVIRNITLTRLNNSSYVGLFGYVGDGGVIRNLGIENAVVAGGEYVGGLVGKIETGTVSNCYVTGSVNGFSYLGGLIGSIDGGTVNNCYSNVIVTAWDSDDSSYIGGLIGRNSMASISQCYTLGRVTGSDGNQRYIGGIVGNNSGDITSCYSTCTVEGANDYIGGLAGSNSGTITLSYSTGSTFGSTYIGGLSGRNDGIIANCYSTSPVGGIGTHIGGLVGINSDTITSSYSSGVVTGTGNFTGGLAGYNSSVITACFWDTQTSGKTTSAGGTGKMTVEMNTLLTFTDVGWDFTDSDGDSADWLMSGYPHLICEAETVIMVPDVAGQTLEQAQTTLKALNLGFTLSCAASDIVGAGQVISQMPLTGTEMPAGFSVNLVLSCGPKYSGSGTILDPYQITNKYEFLLLTNTPVDYDKTFILSADIDLSGFPLTQALIAPDTSPVSGFQGTQFTGLFDGCGYSISNLTVIAAAQNYTGLFGCLGQGAMIKNLSLENASVTGWNYVGGLAGYNNSGTITHCRTSGRIGGVLYCGGLTGFNSGLVDRCNSMADVGSFYNSQNVGGLAGNNSGIIALSYSTGTVSGNGNIGGLVGYLAGSASKIEKCYSAGSVVGNYSGGLLGFKQLSGSVVTASFWDVEASGQAASAGSSVVQGKTTDQMKTLATFISAGWDFAGEAPNGTEDIWRMCQDGVNYPQLSWEYPDGDFGCPDGVGVEDLSMLSACWLETMQVKADIDDSDAVDFGDILLLSQNWLRAGCVTCNGADITGDGEVNELDLQPMAEQWLMIENAGCRMGDLDDSGSVDLEDFSVFAGHWLEGI